MKHSEIEHVAILPNNQGGYSLYPVRYEARKHSPDHTEIRKVTEGKAGLGNFATVGDAAKRAAMNFWEVVQFPVTRDDCVQLIPNLALQTTGQN